VTQAPQAPVNLDTVLARVRQHMPNLENDNSCLATVVGNAQLSPAPTRP